MRNYYAIVLSIVILISQGCTKPLSKESYLEKYDSFIADVGENYEEYNEKDWKKADEKFKKFDEEWYVDFKGDMTVKEQLIVTKHSLKYKYYKAYTNAESFYDVFLKEDVQKLREQVKYYRENHMDEDLEKLKKEAKKMGDSALVIVEDIIEEVDTELSK